MSAGVLKNDPKTHKKLKRTYFNQTKQDRMRFFLRKSSCSKLHTIQKQTNKQFTFLLPVGFLRIFLIFNFQGISILDSSCVAMLWCSIALNCTVFLVQYLYCNVNTVLKIINNETRKNSFCNCRGFDTHNHIEKKVVWVSCCTVQL